MVEVHVGREHVVVHQYEVVGVSLGERREDTSTDVRDAGLLTDLVGTGEDDAVGLATERLDLEADVPLGYTEVNETAGRDGEADHLTDHLAHRLLDDLAVGGRYVAERTGAVVADDLTGLFEGFGEFGTETDVHHGDDSIDDFLSKVKREVVGPAGIEPTQ